MYIVFIFDYWSNEIARNLWKPFVIQRCKFLSNFIIVFWNEYICMKREGSYASHVSSYIMRNIDERHVIYFIIFSVRMSKNITVPTLEHIFFS